jgi:predicted GNAT family acetyltransferase
MDNETLASLLRGRNRAGQPVDATANIIGPAMSALGNTIYGAGRGALTAMAGLPGDINQLITDNIGTLVNAQGLPTTKEIQDFLPAKPTSYEGKLAQKLGEFVPVNPTPIAKGAVAIAKPVGKAMGEQAYRMTEDMLQKQGMMPSIVAYHGTPHNIEGAFDISKVGTGEGAQAYGHGMYYAENPKVATEYQKRLSGKTTFGESPSDSAYVHAVESFRDANYPLEQIPAEMKKAYKSITDKDIQLAIQASEKGNLYKVDIPDKDIPKMVIFETPLSDMDEKLAAVIKPLQEQLKNQPNPDLFKNAKSVGDVIQYSNAVGLKPHIPLQAAGFTGIRYLDEGSRGKGKGTSNFVVFDPKEVKILEKNSKPVNTLENVVAPLKEKGLTLDIYESKNNPNKLVLSKIEVPKELRKSGVGSNAMQELTGFADKENKTITLSPSTDFGGSSVSRLKDFYKRFGFVENKGRYKDYSISESMYRLPTKLSRKDIIEEQVNNLK